jgi:preprotein translocase SecF subunit
MRPLIVIRRVPQIDFMRWHVYGLVFSLALTAVTIGLFLSKGLNYGIDFTGGTLIEVRVPNGPADLAGMRAKLDALKIGEPTLQGYTDQTTAECGSSPPSCVLIRLPQQAGGDAAQQKVVQKVREALGSGVEYRRTEVVGPSVGSELIRAGVLATVLALGAIMIYVWFRFEWQFGVGATIATLHDVITTVGLFAIFQLEFNLTTLAAILTIAGYSINDTVVIYDRMRESMRKYRTMPFRDLINLALNETLSRTILTVATTTLAVLALLFLGGEVLRGFSIAMLWGIVIGTYSSLFIAAPLLYYVQPNRRAIARTEENAEVPAERASR